jgi:hypothetical protein
MATIKQNLMDLFEIEKMPEEKREDTLNRLTTLILESTLMRALPLLSEENMTEYEDILESKQSPEVLFNFLSSKIPSFEDIMKEEADMLHKELSGELEALNS